MKTRPSTSSISWAVQMFGWLEQTLPSPHVGIAPALAGLWLGIRQELQRDMATKLNILGLVHHRHSAAAQLAQDAIVVERLADELRRRCHWREW